MSKVAGLIADAGGTAGRSNPSLDSTIDVAVPRALGEAPGGGTARVIAQRLNTLRATDEILVMEPKEILERGTHGW